MDWLNDEEEAAWRGLQRMQARLAGTLNRELSAGAGLSLGDYGVLAVLTDEPGGPMRANDLGRELGWEKSRLSHHVSRLARRGLVTRRRCPTDHRGLFVAITDRGRDAIREAAPGHVAAVRRAFVDLLSPSQLRALTEIAATVAPDRPRSLP